MHFELHCPRCRAPIREDISVDRGDPEIRDLPPVIFQAMKCYKCGYSKVHVLQGLPDDEKTYEEWARDEANLLTGVLFDVPAEGQ